MTTSELYDTEIDGDVLVISLDSRVKRMEESAALCDRQLLRTEFIENAAIHAVVDFNQLSYFSSNLLEALLQLWKPVEAGNGRMAICNLSPTAREIIAVSHFDQLWPICDSREMALRTVMADSTHRM